MHGKSCTIDNEGFFILNINGGQKMSSNKDNPAMQRITRLVDANSFMEIGGSVTARSTDFNLTEAKAPSDGVIVGHGLIEGKLVFFYSQDADVVGGTIGEMHAKKITHVYDLAMKMGAPVIGFLDCGGLRLQESLDALNGFGSIYAKMVEASGVVPQISVVCGTCGGGLSVIPALSDFAFLVAENGRMFLNSPDAVTGNRVDLCDTASAVFQSKENGCIDACGDEEEIYAAIRTLIDFLPSNCQGDLYTANCTDDLNRACEGIASQIAEPSYILSAISDDNLFFETKKDYAKDMMTGFLRLGGMTATRLQGGKVIFRLALLEIRCIRKTQMCGFQRQERRRLRILSASVTPFPSRSLRLPTWRAMRKRSRRSRDLHEISLPWCAHYPAPQYRR